MAIIRQTNKKTGITYVIESHSYWDKERQQTRAHRTVIGKVDPETGEVVPTRSYNRKKVSPSCNSPDAEAACRPSDDAIPADNDKQLEDELCRLKEENQRLKEILGQIASLALIN